MKKLMVFCLLTLSLFSSDYKFSGIHYMASYVNCDPNALCSLSKLKEAMIASVDASGATILEMSEYVFPPDAITMVFLLSESHASIHTYPEYSSCYVDLFTCGEKCDYRKFEETLKNYLHPETTETHIMRR